MKIPLQMPSSAVSWSQINAYVLRKQKGININIYSLLHVTSERTFCNLSFIFLLCIDMNLASFLIVGLKKD